MAFLWCFHTPLNCHCCIGVIATAYCSMWHIYFNVYLCPTLHLSGSCPCTAPAVGQLPGSLVFSREPYSSRGGQWKETETAGAQTDEEILTMLCRLLYFLYTEPNIQLSMNSRVKLFRRNRHWQWTRPCGTTGLPLLFSLHPNCYTFLNLTFTFEELIMK